MEKAKKQIIFLSLILIVFISLVIFFAHRIYSVSKHTLANQFNYQQLMLADQIANGIEKFFMEKEKKLELLASFPAVKHLSEECLNDMKAFYEQEKGEIRFLGRIDRDGNLKYFLANEGWNRVNRNYRGAAYFIKVGETLRPFISISYHNKKNLEIIVVVPVISKSDIPTKKFSDKDVEFAGALMLEIEIGRVIESFILPVTSGKHGFAWLLDEKGILLNHIKHPEMVNRNIFTPDKNCLSCHHSFSIEMDMAKGNTGTGKYSVKGSQEYFIAYAPIHLKNHLWSVGVVASVSEVEELLKVNLRNTLILVIFIIFCFSGGAFLIVRINAKRILLEEREKMKMRVEQSEKLASIGTFASSLAHEVRNPLNSINLQLTLLEKRFSKVEIDIRDEVTRLINIVRKEISELNRLVEDFLMLSKSTKINFVKDNINSILEEVLKLVELEARDKGVLIKKNYNQIPLFLMDPGKIKQVFLNLIHNSLEAMPDGGELVVNTQLDNGDAIIRIKDTGIGIKDGEKVFDVFYSTKDGGTGLGLPIAHRIIEDHNGRIEFESKPGEWTIFTIIIPINDKSK